MILRIASAPFAHLQLLVGGGIVDTYQDALGLQAFTASEAEDLAWLYSAIVRRPRFPHPGAERLAFRPITDRIRSVQQRILSYLARLRARREAESDPGRKRAPTISARWSDHPRSQAEHPENPTP